MSRLHGAGGWGSTGGEGRTHYTTLQSLNLKCFRYVTHKQHHHPSRSTIPCPVESGHFDYQFCYYFLARGAVPGLLFSFITGMRSRFTHVWCKRAPPFFFSMNIMMLLILLAILSCAAADNAYIKIDTSSRQFVGPEGEYFYC